MDMRYWIPAGAVSPDEEKETDFLTDETQRTPSQADGPKSPKMPKNNRVAFDKVDAYSI